LYAQKAFDQAIADCDKVLKLDPGRAPMYGLRGRCHAERGDTESALRDYATAITGDPPNAPRYLLWRAQLHLDCDDYAAAEADVTNVIRAEPETPEAFYPRGTVRQQNGDADGAAEDYTTALVLKPDHAFALLGRSVCHLMRKDYVSVVVDCDRVIELMPGVV